MLDENFQDFTDEQFQYQAHRECVAVPQNECATLRIGTSKFFFSFAVAWNGKIEKEIAKGGKNKNQKVYKLGECSS